MFIDNYERLYIRKLPKPLYKKMEACVIKRMAVIIYTENS